MAYTKVSENTFVGNEVDSSINDQKDEKRKVLSTAEEPRHSDFETALKNFKRHAGSIISKYREHQAYEKPSVKRRKKFEKARRRNAKRNKFLHDRGS